jgi:periplasmic protein CpxP/Spy
MKGGSMIDRKHWKSMMGFMVLTIAACALVMTMLTGCRHPGQGNIAPEKIAEQIIGKISSELDLNEGQKQYLDKVKQELLGKAAEMKENHQAMRKEVLAQLRQDAIDQEQLKKLVADHRAKADSVISLLITRLAEFHSMLTPEQKDKLIKHLEEIETKGSDCPFRAER